MRESASLIAKARESRARLPFESIPTLWVASIEFALRKAWKELIDHQLKYKVDVHAADEHKISEPLVTALNFLLRNKAADDPFLTVVKYFERAYVGAGFRNYKNEEIQQPDIVLMPRIAPHAGIEAQYFAIFIEAKVISNHAHQSISEYFRDGVDRFIDGRYAWAMPQGLMLAYLRNVDLDASNIIKTYLEPNKRRQRFGVEDDSVRVYPPNPYPKVHQTQHSRIWNYPDGGGSPGSIRIRHLWLNIYA